MLTSGVGLTSGASSLQTCSIAAVIGLASSICLVGSDPARATPSTITACEAWKSEAPGDDVSSWLKSVLVGLFELRQASEPSASPSEAELFFTTTSDFSSKPICRENRAPSRTNHLYYPIGIVVKKLGEVELQGRFWLVETEYGLKTYIRESHLAPLRKDRVYFFANTANATKSYCLGQADEPCLRADYIRNRRLDPQSRYAVAELEEFERRGYGGHNYIFQDSGLPCGVINVGIYGGRSSGSKPTAEEYGRLTTCLEQDKPVMQDGTRLETSSPIFDPAIKLVRHADYHAYFAKKIESAVFRFDKSLLSKIAPEFGAQKPCNTTLKFETGTGYKLEGGVGVSIKYLAAIEIGGSATKTHLRKFEREYPASVAISLQAYDLVTEIEDAGAKAAPIIIRYGCETGPSAPQTAHEIRVSHPTLGDQGDFIIGIKDLDDEGDKSGVLAIVSHDKSELFNEGFVFLIQGSQDYFSVRDKIFGILLQHSYNKIQEFYDNPDDQLYLQRATDFLTHLIIATAGKPSFRVRH